MTDLNTSVQVILQDAGYDTWLLSLDSNEVVGFEDESVMGFVNVFQDADAMLAHWKELEAKFLASHASALQKAGDKTWNVYSVLLCAPAASSDQQREIRWIEEDLELTRKVTGWAITGRTELVTALLPLLPIQQQPLLDSEDFNLVQRFRKRVDAIAPTATEAVLNETINAAEVARLLAETE